VVSFERLQDVYVAAREHLAKLRANVGELQNALNEQET